MSITEKRPTVPGAKWVNYTRPLEVSAVPAKPKPTERPKPTVARFLLDGPVLPLVTDTLPVAEAFRRVVMGRFQRHCHRQKYGHAEKPYRELFRSEVLSGKDAAGQIMKNHRHAFYLPAAEGDDPRRITHVTVVADRGFGPDELAALNAARTLKLDDESADLRIQLVALGHLQDFRTPLLAESAVWISATPFVVTRYPKRRGTRRDRPEDYATPQAFAEHVLRQELERRPDMPEVVSVEVEELIGKQRLRPIQFKRFRSKPGDDGGRRPACGFRITFAAPVHGPVCLGHSCHFGLGQFMPSSPSAHREPR